MVDDWDGECGLRLTVLGLVASFANDYLPAACLCSNLSFSASGQWAVLLGQARPRSSSLKRADNADCSSRILTQKKGADPWICSRWECEIFLA
jgi:hypothetical protein